MRNYLSHDNIQPEIKQYAACRAKLGTKELGEVPTKDVSSPISSLPLFLIVRNIRAALTWEWEKFNQKESKVTCKLIVRSCTLIANCIVQTHLSEAFERSMEDLSISLYVDIS